jgi:hypothetical protein
MQVLSALARFRVSPKYARSRTGIPGLFRSDTRAAPDREMANRHGARLHHDRKISISATTRKSACTPPFTQNVHRHNVAVSVRGSAPAMRTILSLRELSDTRKFKLGNLARSYSQIREHSSTA